jgi:hypothetical protein
MHVFNKLTTRKKNILESMDEKSKENFESAQMTLEKALDTEINDWLNYVKLYEIKIGHNLPQVPEILLPEENIEFEWSSTPEASDYFNTDTEIKTFRNCFEELENIKANEGFTGSLKEFVQSHWKADVDERKKAIVLALLELSEKVHRNETDSRQHFKKLLNLVNDRYNQIRLCVHPDQGVINSTEFSTALFTTLAALAAPFETKKQER